MVQSFKQLLWLAWIGSFVYVFAGHLVFVHTAYPITKASVLILYVLTAWAIAKRSMALLRLVWRLLCLIDDALPI